MNRKKIVLFLESKLLSRNAAWRDAASFQPQHHATTPPSSHTPVVGG
jgi:hypothetical protein